MFYSTTIDKCFILFYLLQIRYKEIIECTTCYNTYILFGFVLFILIIGKSAAESKLSVSD